MMAMMVSLDNVTLFIPTSYSVRNPHIYNINVVYHQSISELVNSQTDHDWIYVSKLILITQIQVATRVLSTGGGPPNH